MTPVHLFELILGLMGVVLVLEVVARRVRMPPSAVLVVGGLVLALIPSVPNLSLDPDLILLLFLPPLLFSSAYFTVWRDFRDNLRIILQLAVGAVVFTTLVVGVVTHLVVPSLPWAACFALGAIVSPPDAVAAKAVLKGVKLPQRMTTLLEGESLVNDATGLVLFRVAIAAGMTATFDAWSALGSFAVLSVGGAVVGIIYGQALAMVLARFREPHLNIVGSLLGAWGSYMVGEMAHVSGVLSTVSAGLVLGWRQHDLFPAFVRIQANAVWNVLVFLLESLIFVVIGLSLHAVLTRLEATGTSLWSLAGPVAAIAGAMTLARFVWIIPLTYIPRFLSRSLRERDPYPQFAVPVVMSWAGMRGVVSLAVALSVPEEFPGRDFLLAVTLAVILITILVQGTTLAPLLRFLRVGDFRLETGPTLAEAEARAQTALAAWDAIRERSRTADGGEQHPRLVEQYGHRVMMATNYLTATEELAPHRQAHYAAILHANRAGRAKLLQLHRSGQIHDSVLHMLEAELDLEELAARQAVSSMEEGGMDQ